MTLITSTQRWKPVDPAARLSPGMPGTPSPALYLAVVNQFEVQSNPRYLAGEGETWCNVFLWDVTRALGVEIPHWVDPTNGAPVEPGKGHELSANAVVGWLERFGGAYGWESVRREAAVELANAGVPAVVVYRNPQGHGHVAVVIPGPDREATIAQAGAHNFASARLERGFGSLPVSFYVATAYARPTTNGHFNPNMPPG